MAELEKRSVLSLVHMYFIKRFEILSCGDESCCSFFVFFLAVYIQRIVPSLSIGYLTSPFHHLVET